MRIQRVLLAAAAVLTLAAPAAALAAPHDGFRSDRGDVHRGNDDRGGGFRERRDDGRDGWNFRHHRHHHHRWEDRRWR